MKKIRDIIASIQLDHHISTTDIPDIDLYMDQVIQLFEKTFYDSKRNENDKIMTKTMINNYAKGNLLLPIKNKKYSTEHIMLIGLIFELKGALSINDIKKLLERANQRTTNKDLDLSALYSSYLNLSSNNVDTFREHMNTHIDVVETAVKEMEEEEYVQQVLLILSLINMSNLYRKAAEKLIDQFPQLTEDSSS